MEFEHVVSFHEAPWHYSLLSTSSSPVSLVHACALLAGARALSFRSLLPCVSLTLPDDAFFHWRLKFISSRICNPKIRNIHSSLLCPSLRPHWMQPPHLLSVFFALSARVCSSSAVHMKALVTVTSISHPSFVSHRGFFTTIHRPSPCSYQRKSRHEWGEM